MTYTVSSGTLNPSIPYHSCHPTNSVKALKGTVILLKMFSHSVAYINITTVATPITIAGIWSSLRTAVSQITPSPQISHHSQQEVCPYPFHHRWYGRQSAFNEYITVIPEYQSCCLTEQKRVADRLSFLANGHVAMEQHYSKPRLHFFRNSTIIHPYSNHTFVSIPVATVQNQLPFLCNRWGSHCPVHIPMQLSIVSRWSGQQLWTDRVSVQTVRH